MTTAMRILVLGAGGSRAFAHIGVIKVLEADGIEPQMLPLLFDAFVQAERLAPYTGRAADVDVSRGAAGTQQVLLVRVRVDRLIEPGPLLWAAGKPDQTIFDFQFSIFD